MFCLLERDKYPTSVSLGYQKIVYSRGNHQFHTNHNHQSYSVLKLSADGVTVRLRTLIPLLAQIWSNHAATPFGTKCKDLYPRETRMFCRCLALVPTWSYATGRVRGAGRTSGTHSQVQAHWYSAPEGCIGTSCKLGHRSRRLGGWTGFWPNGKCFHKSSVKYCWKSPLCHFEKYWCLFFFFPFSGNFHWGSWISEFVMKQNLVAWSHLCQKHGPNMTWYILQRMWPDVRMVHTDSQIDGFQMSCIKDHPLCKN